VALGVEAATLAGAAAVAQEWRLVGPSGATAPVSPATKWPHWSQQWQAWRVKAAWQYVLPQVQQPASGPLVKALDLALHGRTKEAAPLVEASALALTGTNPEACVDVAVLAVLSGSAEAKAAVGRCFDPPQASWRNTKPLALALAGHCTAAAYAVPEDDISAWPVVRLCAAHHAWSAVGHIADRQTKTSPGTFPDWTEVGIVAAIGRCEAKEALMRLNGAQHEPPALGPAIAQLFAAQDQLEQAIVVMADTPGLTDTDADQLRVWFARWVNPSATRLPVSPCSDNQTAGTKPTPAEASADPEHNAAVDLTTPNQAAMARWLALKPRLPKSAGGDLVSAIAAVTLQQPAQAEAALSLLPAAMSQFLQVQLLRLEIAAQRGQPREVQQLADRLVQQDPYLFEARWQLAKLTARTDLPLAMSHLRAYKTTVQARADLAWQVSLVDRALGLLEEQAEAHKHVAEDQAPDITTDVDVQRVDLGLTWAPIAALAGVLLLPVALWWRQRRASQTRAKQGPLP
jgi:hypothetical protein